MSPSAETMPTAITDSHQASDAALAARLACGDARALDPLYRRHKGPVYRFALLWSGAAAVAADVTQDVFVHLLTRADDFDPSRGPLQPWLLGIARNFVRRRTGTLAREEEHEPDDLRLPAATDGAGLDDALAARRDVDRLRAAIAALPPHYRDVLVLVEIAERSYADAAAICGCELNTVRSRLSRARGLLARALGLDAVERAAGAATAKGHR
jgi:RNA polymerase sigma-70 factor (ECF subfamily)